MTDYPDFSANGYQITDQLGQNNLGGRVTYLARQTDTQEQVVIKQFQFAQMGATWAEYDAYSQEIAMLQHLNHPGIPRYLDSFQTSDGFCMVTEYIDAKSLAVGRSWNPGEIKQVARATLEILVYLQSLNPPVIHRDIKPENILIDENLKIYLVDFGFARIGGGEIAASSVVKGTMGFMPTEQLFNRQLTTASDLYGLGATLICLLTGTKSGDIGNLIDENYRIEFQHLVPPLKRGLINWLEKITQPNPQDRYPSAAAALAALKSIDVDRLPKVRMQQDSLEFLVSEYGAKATQTIHISNPIPDTVLAGRWQVAPHLSDPPHTAYDHSWVSFDSQKFEGNDVECQITVDTSNLLAEETYHRQLLLHSNSDGEALKIPLVVKTAALPQKKPNYFFLIIAAVASPVLILVFPWVLIGLIVGKKAIARPDIYLKNTSLFVVSSLASLCSIFWAFFARNHILQNSDYPGLNVFLELPAILLIYGIIHSLIFAEIVTWMLGKLNPNQRRRCYFYLIVLFAIFLSFAMSPAIDVIMATIITTFIWAILSLPAWIVARCVKIFSVEFEKTTGLKGKDGFKSILLSAGLGICGVFAYSLLPKIFDPAEALWLTSPEKALVEIVAIAPLLIIGWQLGKLIIYRPIQQWINNAKYTREKDNLIKP